MAKCAPASNNGNVDWPGFMFFLFVHGVAPIYKVMGLGFRKHALAAN